MFVNIHIKSKVVKHIKKANSAKKIYPRSKVCVRAGASLFRLPGEEKNTESRVSFPYWSQERADQGGQGAEGGITE